MISATPWWSSGSGLVVGWGDWAGKSETIGARHAVRLRDEEERARAVAPD